MLLKLIVLFTLMPIIELAILIKLSKYIGLGYTILIVLFTGFFGAYMARREGRSVLQRIKIEMSQGRMPGDELINGLCIIIGGILLLAPGIVTDITGFLLVVPILRETVKNLIKGKIRKMISEGTFVYYYRE